MDVRPLLAAALLLAGCAAAPAGDLPEPTGLPASAASCPFQPRPLSAEVEAAGYTVRTPDGGSTGGHRYKEFPFSADKRHLVRLDLRLEWDADTPLTERLGLGIPSAVPTPDFYAYGPFEGPSPLLAAIESPDPALLGDLLRVDFGEAGDQTPAGGVAEPPEDALLVVQETYDPCAG